MTQDVLLFGPLAASFGRPSAPVSLPEGATVRDLLLALEEAYPGLGRLEGRVAVAVQKRYAPLDLVLTPGQEIALIPPVSGG